VADIQANYPEPRGPRIDPRILKEFKGQHPALRAHKVFTSISERRSKLQQKWVVVLNMLASEQWLRWHPRTRIIDRLSDMRDSRRPDVIRAVSNKLLPAQDYKVGALSAVYHLPEVVPLRDRADMLDTAELRTQYLQATADLREVKRKDRDLKSWVVGLGHGYVKTWWDAESQLPDIAVRTPFNLACVPWGITDITESTATIETVAVPLDDLQRDYPGPMKGFHKTELDEDYNTLLASTDSFLQHQGREREIEGLVTVHEIHQRPNKTHPRGFKMICTRKRVLELMPLPDPDLYPAYFQFRYRPFPGALYPPGLHDPNISLQVMRNKLLSDIMGSLWAEGSGRRLMIPQSLNITPDDFENTGAPIEYDDDEQNPDNVPWYLVAPGLQTDGWRAMERVDVDLDDALQLHPASRGQHPGSIESGAGIEALQVKDDVLMGPLLDDFNEQWARVFRRMGVLTSRHQKQPANLLGVDPMSASPYAVEDFMADKDETSWRVRVRCVNRGPQQKAVTLQNNRELLQFGAFNDLPPQQVRRRFEQGVEASLFEEEAYDRAEAKYENARILKGEPGVEAHTWNNDEAHLKEHYRECKHPRFHDAPVEIKEYMLEHIGAHEQRIAAAMQGQAGLQQGEPEPQGGMV
jgi:hypothetical protein